MPSRSCRSPCGTNAGSHIHACIQTQVQARKGVIKIANNAVADPSEVAAKPENPESNNSGTRASRVLEGMSQFKNDIKFIKERFADYERTGKEALQALIDMGGKLTAVREWLDNHNETAPKELNQVWEQWCDENLPFGKRQANRYIKIFKNEDKIEFTEEKVSVRAALVMITDGKGKGKGKKGIKAVARGKGEFKSKIEAVPTRNAKGTIKDHRIRLTWSDEKTGKFLYSRGEKKVSADDSETMAGACAKLFAMALDDKFGDVGKRICRAIRDIPDSWRDEDTLTAIAKAVEGRGIALQPANGNGGFRGTGGTGAMGVPNQMGQTAGQLIGAGA